MSKYAEFIDDIDFQKREIYDKFAYYFDNPEMTKTSVVEGNSVYAVKIRTGLMLDKKYILAIVPNDNSSVGARSKLSSLDWVSLQTRTLRDDLKTGQHSYSPKRDQIFSDKIELKSRDDKNSMYEHTVLKNIVISLLHTEKMQTMYSNTGTLSAALETYKTVVVVK